mmetsp:Transcript_36540/g.49421  ORF Transcript_36540/g.49421 Transcript_36540/m.49421 type:complete len:218 (-) Transcript_36540:415-1068(-)
MRVSWESLYGMCSWPADRAKTTFPNAVSDELMSTASRMRMSSDLDFFSRSLPARSTRLSLPTTVPPVRKSEVVMLMVYTVWDRDETAFMLVSWVARSFSPSVTTVRATSFDDAWIVVTSLTKTFPFASSRISWSMNRSSFTSKCSKCSLLSMGVPVSWPIAYLNASSLSRFDLRYSADVLFSRALSLFDLDDLLSSELFASSTYFKYALPKSRIFPK